MSLSIPSAFSSRSIFITGGTGFLGNVLIHALLTKCPDLDTLYILIRAKRGKTPQERLEDMLSSCPALSILPQSAKEKLKGISGDVTEENLGLSPEDYNQLCDKVSIVYHSAATVRFDEPMSYAIKMNVFGTKSVLDLAKNMRNLDVFVHVSTAYTHCDRSKEEVIGEEIYPNADLLGSDFGESYMALERGSEEEKRVLGRRPNTYAFSKAMGEQLFLRDEYRGLPVVIVRPSIVVGAIKDPFPGFVTNFNGMTGMIAAFASGYLRSIYANRSCKADIVPVDTVINLMCTATAVKIANNKNNTNDNNNNNDNNNSNNNNNNITVYNCTSGKSNPILWGEIEKLCLPLIRKYPTEKLLFYPWGVFCSNIHLDSTVRFFTNHCVAKISDIIPFTRKLQLGKITKRLDNEMSALRYFANNEWSWEDRNVRDLLKSLKEEEEKEMFGFDIKEVDWNDFMEIYVLGVRRFALKEKPETLERSRRQLERAKVCYYTTAAMLGFLLLWLLFSLAYVFYNLF